MVLKKDFNWAQSCTNQNGKWGGNYHRIQVCYSYIHEHPQYKCFDCGTRFTPLELIDKKESYIEKVIQFFRWRTNND